MLLRLCLSFILWLAGTSAVEAARLQSTVTVEAAEITLGDLFANAGDQAGTWLAPAPAPGERQVLPLRRVAAIARQYGLAFQAPPGLRAVTIHRAGQPLPLQDLRETMHALLLKAGLPADHDIALRAGGAPIYLPVPTTGSEAAPYSVHNLNYLPQKGTFTAIVTIDIGGGEFRKRKLAGRSFRVVEVPVLKQAVHRGQVIREADIAWTSLPAARLPRGVVSNLDGVEGQVAKRLLAPGVALRERDLAPNWLVQKNATVTISLEAPGLHLSTLGQAQEAGILGDVVTVKNTASGRLIEAEVIARDHVQVGRLRAPSPQQVGSR